MKKIISAIVASILVCTSIAFAHPFSDVSGHWAEAEIEKGFENQAINGDPDGKFRPDDTITRAEFLKMLAADICKRVEVEIPQEFDDGVHWSSKYHNFANSYIYEGINSEVHGVKPGIMETEAEFEKAISRWEMAFMLANAMGNVIGVTSQGVQSVEFKDADTINAELPDIIAKSIFVCNEFSVMTGDEKSCFNAFDNGTRAEAITVVNRFDKMLSDAIETQIKLEEEYQNQIKESLITYDEIPQGHPVAIMTMSDNKRVEIELYPEYAPQTVANFVSLAKSGFYNGLTFHRVVEGFMAQGGDPLGNGMGGAKNNIKGEFVANGFDKNTLSHKRGVISMARAQHFDSASSQFFICYNDASFLDGQYAAFGKVTSGMETVDAFLENEMEYNSMGEFASPKKPIVIKSITIR